MHVGPYKESTDGVYWYLAPPPPPPIDRQTQPETRLDVLVASLFSAHNYVY